jgi:hypothetical protein
LRKAGTEAASATTIVPEAAAATRPAPAAGVTTAKKEAIAKPLSSFACPDMAGLENRSRIVRPFPKERSFDLLFPLAMK